MTRQRCWTADWVIDLNINGFFDALRHDLVERADVWMRRFHPSTPFERYADDAVIHCRSKQEAESVLSAIRGRFAECGLELHPTKTRIVYCKDSNRRGEHEHVAFDFLGYTLKWTRSPGPKAGRRKLLACSCFCFS